MSGNRITSTLCSFCHSTVTFCDQAWWAIKTMLRPSLMSFLAMTASFPFFLYGYDVAMADSASLIANDLHLSDYQVSMYLMCVARTANALGAVVAGLATNYYGRRYLLAVGGVVYMLGAMLVVFTTNYIVSVVGRALTGFGVGMGLLLGPIYIAETAPSTTRGYHGSFPQVLLVVGAMTAQVLELATCWVPRHLAWRVIAGVATLPTAIFTYVIVSRRFYDTPCWMMMCGQVREAERLMEICGATGAEPWDRRENLEHVAGFPVGYAVDPRRADLFPGRITGFWADMMDRIGSYYPDLCTTVVLYVAQEATWEWTVVTLVRTLLARNGMSSQWWSLSVAPLVLASVQLVAMLISMIVTGRSMARRRGLLLVGVGLVLCSQGFLSGTTFVDAHGRISQGTSFALSCVGLLVLEIAIGLGLGPIPWMYGPEVFPLKVRAPSIAFCLLSKFCSNFVFVWTLPMVYFTFERAWLGFLTAAGVTLVCFLFFCRFVRKTSCRLLMDHSY